jgi:hypothetical protein
VIGIVGGVLEYEVVFVIGLLINKCIRPAVGINVVFGGGGLAV